MREQEKKAFFRSAFLSVFVHAGILVFAVSHGSGDRGPGPTELLVTLSEYDPLGGEAGGLAAPEDILSALMPAEAPPEPAFEEEWFEEPLPAEEVALIESDNGELMPEIFEEEPPLAELPPEPPKPKPKPAPKPKTPPKPAAAPSSARAIAAAPGDVAPSAGQSLGTGQGGFGGGTGKGAKKMLDSYVSKVRSRLDRNKKYPNRAEANNGVVEVNFTILSDGRVAGTRIVASSGHAALDDEVLALVRRVEPFAPIPPEIGRERLNLTVPVVFSRR
ncbi:MAG: energy transducer TonB [Deltaproteobacteria bacterium]|jgi:protein TonB|nr:energy transducer TonB [Deltaproteobacteria bacterium]